MESLLLEPTEETFGINFDTSSGEFKISGRCLPEDVNVFFKPILDWVSAYVESGGTDTTLLFDVDYFHTATTKPLLEFFSLFENLQSKGRSINVIWRFHEDDGDMQDTGIELAEIVNLPFQEESYSD